MAKVPDAKIWVEISESALKNNIRALRAILEPGTEFCAIVKANAYGHGLQEVVQIALEEGVTQFGVDSVSEAKIVRELSAEATIFIMGATPKALLQDVIVLRAIQTVFDVEGAQAYVEAAEKVGMPALATLEGETGLHRLGADGKGLQEILDVFLLHVGKIYLVSFASHLSSAEDASKVKQTLAQYEAFANIASVLHEQGFRPFFYHIACSAAAILYDAHHGTLVRFGILMYGLWPSKDVKREGVLGKRHVEIKPVLSWKTRIAQVKELVPGDGVGYGPAFIANRSMRIAVLPIGYADGFDRGFSNNGSVIINGTKCPIIGNICMNMCFVDVSNAPGILSADTEVTLLGKDGMHSLSADELAERIATIHYEVVTRISPLIPRKRTS